jgi:hypothetical protein
VGEIVFGEVLSGLAKDALSCEATRERARLRADYLSMVSVC